MENRDKLILDLCGGTGSWIKPYADAGYRVKVLTLPEYDVCKVAFFPNCMVFYSPESVGKQYLIEYDAVYGILAAPPCTMFSFCRTVAKEPRDLKGAMDIVQACLDIIWHCQYKTKIDTQKKPPLKFWALENPNGMLKYFLGLPVFQFNPYDFGDDYKKNTHLWGYFNFPEKKPIKCTKPKFDKLLSKEIQPEFYGKLTRTERRSMTPPGFAKAFFEANR